MDLSRAFSAGGAGNNGGGGLAAFDAAEPAPEYQPLPPGVYKARVLRGEYTTTRAGADAYRMRFEIVDGEHKGQSVIRTWTFSAKAIAYTKRDLAPFGLTTSAALLSPFPAAGREYHVRLTVAIRRLDDGRAVNDVKRVELLRVVDSPAAEGRR